MKIISLLTILSFLLIACGIDKQICIEKDGKTDCKLYQQYGLFDKEELKDPKIQYKVCVENVFWGIVLCETIVIPVLVFGWYLYEPIQAK